MNKNPLLLAFIRVGLFWYVLAALVAYDRPMGFFHGIFDVLPDLGNGLFKALMGGIMGALIYLVIYFSKKVETFIKLLPNHNKFLSFSIGNITENRKFKEVAIVCIPEGFQSWFSQYKIEYPIYAKFFEHLVRIIQAYPEIPASPIPGGHGGLSLETHSWNVLKEALLRQHEWKYTGMKSSQGTVILPVKNPNYCFFPDPMIPFSAFCHDIGKIVCYQVHADVIKEVRPLHDEEGAKIIGSLPEFHDLDFKDQADLLICLGYYHHWRAIPLHVGDRACAIAEFLLFVDKEAGKKEGRIASDTTVENYENATQEAQSHNYVTHLATLAELDVDDLDSPALPQNAVPRKKNSKAKKPEVNFNNDSFLKAISPAGFIQKSIELPVQQDTNHKEDSQNVNFEEEGVQIEGFKTPIKRKFPKNRCDRAYALFMDACTQPGRLNANMGSENIGRKYGRLCFVQEQGVRKMVSQKLAAGHKEKMAQPMEGKAFHEFTVAVLWALYDRNMLVRDFENEQGEPCYVSPNNALYMVKWRDKSGAWIQKPGCIVFTFGPDESVLEKVPDNPACPQIEKSMLGFHNVRKKEVFIRDSNIH